jgi:hypothetical protein
MPYTLFLLLDNDMQYRKILTNKPSGNKIGNVIKLDIIDDQRYKPFVVAKDVSSTSTKTAITDSTPPSTYRDYPFELVVLNKLAGDVKVYMVNLDGEDTSYVSIEEGGPGLVHDRLDWYEVAGGLEVESTSDGTVYVALRSIRTKPNAQRSTYYD